MDARNEFKMMFPPTERKGMKERIGPAISKAFSPSQFIHAQKKKSFYKALSGLSFNESSAKDKKVSTKIEGAKCNPIYMSKSEGYNNKHINSHENNNSRKYSYESHLANDASKQRESLQSQRTRRKTTSIINDNLPIDSLKLRTNIGGYDNIKRSFSSYDNIKKPNQKDSQHSPKHSNERRKNQSYPVNHTTVGSDNIHKDLNHKHEYPVKPQRTRSISQSRRKGIINAPDVMAFQKRFDNNDNFSANDNQRSTLLAEKYEKNYFENLNELKDVDKDFRSRSRRKSEKNLSHSQFANKNNFQNEMNHRVNLGSTDNSNRIKLYSRQNSEETNARTSGEGRGRFRSRSVITPNRGSILPLDQSKPCITDQHSRSRKASSSNRSKPSVVSNMFNTHNQFKSDNLSIDNHHKSELEQADFYDSGLEDNDSSYHAKSKKKSGNSSSSNAMHRRSKYLNDHSKHNLSRSGDENDGGYYSLEKDENTNDITKLPYQLPPPTKLPNPEYFQSDHSVDAIYISQVFMNLDKNNLDPQNKNPSSKNSFCDDYQTISHILGEDIYDNCQGSSLENGDTKNTDNNENYQIVQTVEETEIYEVPFDSKTPEDNEDFYETIEVANHKQVNNDSDEEGDYMDINDFPPIKSETKVTVITIKDSDVAVTEKTLRSKNIPFITTPHVRPDGYFNPYVGKKLSQPNCGDIYDNISKPISNMDDSKYNRDSNSMSHSYPVSKAMIPKLPERNKFMSRSESMNTPNRQSGPNISYQNNVNQYNSQSESNKKTSIDTQKSNGYEFISETNYKVDNLDYTFKLNFSQLPKGSSNMQFIPRESSQTECIPKGSSQTDFVRKTSFRSKTSKVSLSPDQVHIFGDLLQPLTFQDLLKDKNLNPPENEAVLDTNFCDTLKTDSLLYPKSQAQKQLDSLYQNTLNVKRSLERELSNQSFSDNISVCWSEADSEFEFMNVT